MPYAESTLDRWIQGIRSVFREIGVLASPQATEGEVPLLERGPLLTAAGYSWKKEGEHWVEHPVGWDVLFQPPHYRTTLLRRLAAEPTWTMRQRQGETLLMPSDAEAVFSI